MILKRISILNYKNLEQAELEFSPKMNCFIGHVLLFQFFEDVGSGEISYFFFWVLGCCRTETTA